MNITNIEVLILIIVLILGLALFVVPFWKIFEKAGKAGWKSLIPIYNNIILIEIVRKPWWWVLIILFVPILNLVFGIWVVNLLSKSFGKGTEIGRAHV